VASNISQTRVTGGQAPSLGKNRGFELLFEICIGKKSRSQLSNSKTLVPAMFGHDEGDVVVLLVGAEALDFIDDRS
jgi:hypothetical protein